MNNRLGKHQVRPHSPRSIRQRPQYKPQCPIGIDYGTHPFVVDISKSTLDNENFRSVLWTGKNLQLTLMSIDAGKELGIEIHPGIDQFLFIEDGQALVVMGDDAHHMTFKQPACDNFGIFVPAGTWHNIINTGDKCLKLYSIYAPPNHPKGAVHKTKDVAESLNRIRKSCRCNRSRHS